VLFHSSKEILLTLLANATPAFNINPGQPGQTFIHKSLEKIRNTKKMISARDIQIEVDGGVNLDNVKQVKEAGADLIVVGGALFNKQPRESYQALKIAVQ
ncbi:hypothetical protein ACP813_26715, partial [Escherichia coli]